ncbi:MAG TPA: ATP F0F1 synthase subunit B [Rhizomicrobium sp.]|nr:ATP F0F1 synthase subunit B [Rhizomicrobium sp.]
MMEWLQEPELWIGLGFFIVIAIFLYLRVPAFVAAALDARAVAIAKELDEARRLREEAAALLDQFRKKASEAEKEAASIVTEAKEEAERFADEARAQLKAQIERRAKQAQDKIAQAEAHAIAEIRAKAADAAVDAAENLIRARTDVSKAAALIAKSLGELPAKL